MEKQFCPLEFGDYQLDVRVDVGPRVMSFRRHEGPNVFYENPKHIDLPAGGDDYRSYGGHRFLLSPEVDAITYTPDNEAVEVNADAGKHLFTAKTDRWGLQRELSIWGDGAKVCVGHRIYNHGPDPFEVAPWGVSVMVPRGSVWVPQYLILDPSAQKLPARPLVLWPYTEITDPRFGLGTKAIRLSQTNTPIPTKFGTLVEQGIAVYSHPDFTFVKHFPFEAGREYPDFGCNFEAYTRHDMLEVESLGPLAVIEPGHFVDHTETWEILPPVEFKNEDDAGAFIATLLTKH